MNGLDSGAGRGARAFVSRGTGGRDSFPTFGIEGWRTVLGCLLGPLEVDGLGGRTWFQIFGSGGGRTGGAGSFLFCTLVVELRKGFTVASLVSLLPRDSSIRTGG